MGQGVAAHVDSVDGRVTDHVGDVGHGARPRCSRREGPPTFRVAGHDGADPGETAERQVGVEMCFGDRPGAGDGDVEWLHCWLSPVGGEVPRSVAETTAL